MLTVASRRCFAVGVLAAALATAARAQPAPPVAALAAGDAAAVDVARRRLAMLPPERFPERAVLPQLRSEDAFRRRAAAWLLGRARRAPDALAEAARRETDPAVLVPWLAALEVATLIDLSAPARGAVAAAALRERLRRGGDAQPSATEWLAALRDAPVDVASDVARDLVAAVAVPPPTPALLALPDERVALLVAALARRPRPALAPLLDALRADPRRLAEPADRLALLLATPTDVWSRADERSLFVALSAEDAELRRTAADGVDRLGAAATDRLVAVLHQRALDGAPVAELLAPLQSMSPRGERHLVGLARALSADARAAIADWLARRPPERSGPQLAELLRDLVDDAVRHADVPPDPRWLALAAPALDTPARVAFALGVLRDSPSPAAREAAFHALVARGEWHGELLDHAVARLGDDQGWRAFAELARMPPDALPEPAWRRLAQLEHERVTPTVVQLLAQRAGSDPVAAELLLGLARDPRAFGRDLAATAAIRLAPEPIARQAWDALEPGTRVSLARDLARRRAPWVLPALQSLGGLDDADPELLLALARAGDRRVAERLLADPTAVPLRVLKQTEDDVAALLTAVDGPRVLDLLAASDGDLRLVLLRWLCGCPAIDPDGVALRALVARVAGAVGRDDLDALEVRALAQRALAQRPGPRAALVDQLDARLPEGLDDSDRELALELLGAADADPATPMSLRELTFAARLAIVEPLAGERRDAEAGVTRDGVVDGLPAANAFVRAAERVPAAVAHTAVAAAVDALWAHPDACLQPRERLGRLLAFAALRPAQLDAWGEPLAAAVLALPDLAGAWVGPAAHVLARAAEARGELDRAAELAREAAVAFLDERALRPLVRRAFVGDAVLGDGLLPTAALWAEPAILRARAAFAAGAAPAEVAAWLDRAAELGTGDAATLDRIATLRQELAR
ncbi:MAG: hypothetical protein IPM29_21605 [Planctomycetes bacterium]|nr:hypothetical protein [Planctomycetota bacterium]